MPEASARTSAPRNPWAWIPTLYFAEGLPNAIVTTISIVLYKACGVSNARIGVYTGLVLSAVGAQAAVEPGGGYPENAAACGSGECNACSASRLPAIALALPSANFIPLSLALFLARRVRFRHARHRGGRILHPGAF